MECETFICIGGFFQEHDEPILKNLTSINLKFIDEEKAEESGDDSREGTMVCSI